MYTTLARIKEHLRIEPDYTGDDDYITYLYDVAEKTVESHVDFKLCDYEDDEHNIPSPLVHAMLLYIGDLYMSREGNAYGVSVTQVPFTYEYLLSLYKDYSGLYGVYTEKKMIDEICKHIGINQAGDVVIDMNYKLRVLSYGGARAKAYKRLMDRILESAQIDEDGNIIVTT